jgi:hypothetical protein
MTEQQLRKHIKPFLRYAIKHLEQNKKSILLGETKPHNTILCSLIEYYSDHVYITELKKRGYRLNAIDDSLEIVAYLKERLRAVRPAGSGENAIWWYPEVRLHTVAGQQLRIDFCKLQLKIVKP